MQLPQRRVGRAAVSWHDDAIETYRQGRYGFVVAFENSNSAGYGEYELKTWVLE